MNFEQLSQTYDFIEKSKMATHTTAQSYKSLRLNDKTANP